MGHGESNHLRQNDLINLMCVNPAALVVMRCSPGKRRQPGSNPTQFGFLFKTCALWSFYPPQVLMKRRKWLGSISLPILTQESFWCRQSCVLPVLHFHLVCFRSLRQYHSGDGPAASNEGKEHERTVRSFPVDLFDAEPSPEITMSLRGPICLKEVVEERT